ncbi:MAG: TIGR03792 family protein [Spirulinaceae cyanobacterium RM2_2_10]|nr:TIGR03792 family protein [Spirulinaceae cyanobacterium SM2_1_0]NJO20970.1 TIGR03792 family protein [Spirulinaceae cyanobacterium RM2_2_10]
MVIEWLQFRIAPEQRDRFLQADAEIWTATLAEYDGFLGKEVWLNPEQADEVTMVIRWQTRADWSAVPADVLKATDARMAERLGYPPEIIAASEYTVSRWEPYSLADGDR